MMTIQGIYHHTIVVCSKLIDVEDDDNKILDKLLDKLLDNVPDKELVVVANISNAKNHTTLIAEVADGNNDVIPVEESIVVADMGNGVLANKEEYLEAEGKEYINSGNNEEHFPVTNLFAKECYKKNRSKKFRERKRQQR